MSQSGAVYQPTTVTYESNSPQEQWSNRPISYLATSVSDAARRPCGLPCHVNKTIWHVTMLAVSIICFVLGLVFIKIGATGYQQEGFEFYITIATTGGVLLIISLILLVLFLRASRRLCWRNSKDHLDTATGQALTVNPSTDLLVTAQYAPVSEVVYQPPQEDTEQSKLMPQEIKELSNEDTDRMVESDPRIVLRPLNTPAHEET